jgi:pimeloyl-ACP methyl ester carboxylesterase
MTHHESTRIRDMGAMGVRTRVLEAGPADEEAVVFIHGAPGSANDWTLVVGVSRRHELIARTPDNERRPV